MFTFSLIILYYLEDLALSYYIQSKYDKIVIDHINIYFKFSSLSLLISIIFVLFVFYESEFLKVYNQLYRNLLALKILFDIGLIINFVYSVYDQLNHDYIEVLHHTYYVVFGIMALHYVIIYLAIYCKQEIRMSNQTYESMFGSLGEMVENKDMNSSYIEIRFYKVKYI
jgi:hypothetical protein